MASLNDLVRRLSRKIEAGRGIRLEPDDLSLFASTGAFEKLQMAAAEELKVICRERDEARSADTALTTPANIGQINEQDIRAARERARRATRPTKPVRHRPPTSSA